MDSRRDELVPTSARALPMRRRADLTVESAGYHGREYFVVRDPLSMRYYRLTPQQYTLLNLIDGRRSMLELRGELQREFPTFRPSLHVIRSLIADLHEKRLIISERSGQGEALLHAGRLRRRRELWQRFTNVFFIRLPGWDPDWFLARLSAATSWVFHPIALMGAMLLVFAAWSLLLIRADEFSRDLPRFQQFFTWENAVALWLTIGLAKLLHELGHAIACRRFGGECHEIGIAFLVFSPCLYCDVSDAWLVADKWKRIAISAAGMAVEVVLSAVALLIWWLTEPGWLHLLALNVFLVTSLTTILFNANPLLRYDGYYILCDLLEFPNLRAKADSELQRFALRWGCGVEVPSTAAIDGRRRWLLTYSLAAWAYRWILLLSIAIFLQQLLKPYRLEFLGTLLVAVSVGTGLFRTTRSLHAAIALRRSTKLKWQRLSLTAAVLVCVLVAALIVPVPVWVEAPLVIEPDQVHHVFARTGGELVEVLVTPGQRVRRGQTLMRLSNFSKEELYHRLEVARDRQAVEAHVQQLVGDLSRYELAAGTLAHLNRELAEYAAQVEQLTIVAPCDGVVIPAELLTNRPEADDAQQLGTWDGTLLDGRNLGCFVSAGTHLLSIAPRDQFVAQLLISQEDREDFRVGQEVAVKLDSAADRVHRSTIRDIAERHTDGTPAMPTEKSHIHSATRADERPGKHVYQASVTLGNSPALLQAGFRGRARIVVASRSLVEFCWRSLRQTFVFLW